MPKSPRQMPENQRMNLSPAGTVTPQYSFNLSICSSDMDPNAACPTLLFSGSTGEMEMRKKAAALTASRSIAILIRFLIINMPCRFVTCIFLPLFPAPLIHVVNNRPAVSMWVKLLFRYLQPISDPVEMIDINQPDPGDISLLRDPCTSIPLCLFP